MQLANFTFYLGFNLFSLFNFDVVHYHLFSSKPLVKSLKYISYYPFKVQHDIVATDTKTFLHRRRLPISLLLKKIIYFLNYMEIGCNLEFQNGIG